MVCLRPSSASDVIIYTIIPRQKAKERDNFMSPEEARAFGLIDEVVHKREPAPASATEAPAPKGAEASAPKGTERRE